MYSSSYLYSNSNQEAYEQFQKPSAILRSILFVMETTKTQQQKTQSCFYFYMLITVIWSVWSVWSFYFKMSQT